MKNLVIVMTLTVILTFAVTAAFGQPEPGKGGGRGHRPGGQRGGMLMGLFDADKDGKISQQEWIEVFKDIDADGDGILTEEEIQKSRAKVREDRKKEAMIRLDEDGDGSISKEEFPGRDGMFDRIDADGDGSINQDEFDAAHEKRRQMMGERAKERGMNRGRKQFRNKDTNAAE